MHKHEVDKMKVVILAGGYGTRLSGDVNHRPKPLVEIGGKPIIWHIMKMYSAFGLNEFIICCGYKGNLIKEYFSKQRLRQSDVVYELNSGKMEFLKDRVEPWRVTLVDTGMRTGTGGRIKRIKKYIRDETFCLTYADGVSDIDIAKLIDFHKKQNCLATVTAVRPPMKFGILTLAEDRVKVSSFREKPKTDGGWINGGFFVLEPAVLDYIDGDDTAWEKEPLSKLAQEGNLAAYIHNGFWQCMDTIKDKKMLEKIWKTKAAWKTWGY